MKACRAGARGGLGRSSRAGAALICVTALGCARTASPAPPPSRSSAIDLHAGLAACVPEPLEECGNARDDNCNGIIDEGCGQRTGEIQFVIAWNAANADVDLLVTDARGELVEAGRTSAAGLLKERDCPGRKRECRGHNVENVYLDKGDPKPGRYRVKIRLERLNDEDTPIHVTFGARLGQKVYSAELDLERPEEERDASFTW